LSNEKKYRDVVVYAGQLKYGFIYAKENEKCKFGHGVIVEVLADTFTFNDDLVPTKNTSVQKLTQFTASEGKYGLFDGKFRSELTSHLAYKFKQNLVVHLEIQNGTAILNQIMCMLVGTNPFVFSTYKLAVPFEYYTDVEASVVEGADYKMKMFAFKRDYAKE
jgi:hypothetical protein